MMQITPAVRQLLIINVLFLVCSYFVPASTELLALHYPGNPKFHFWQIITHMFMHGGIMHIAFNMFALYQFGSALEHYWGAKKFIFFYLSCGLGSAALHLLVCYFQFHQGADLLLSNGFSSSEITSLFNGGSVNLNGRPAIDQAALLPAAQAYGGIVVGASGAIYGLLVAFAFMFPTAELMLIFLPVPIKAKYFIPGILCLDLFLGLKGQSIFGFGDDGIAHFAHLGGALLGFIMMWMWKRNNFHHTRWD
jgi:membrane associated rhomboid family serine protease